MAAAALVFGLSSAPRALAADDRLQFNGTTLSAAPFNGASLQGKRRAVVLDAMVPVLQRRSPRSEPGGGRNPGVTFVGVAAHSDVGAMQNFVSKYNLNFTNLNDADGSIWARYNVPWQPAWVFYRADGTSDVRQQPHSAMSQQELPAGSTALYLTQ